MPHHAYTFYGHFRDFDSGEYHHRVRRGAAESKPNTKVDKRPAGKSPLGASWGLRCSQIYTLFSRALVTSWSSKPQWKEKTKIFTLCLSLICKFSLFLKIIKPFYVAKQRTKGFPSACMIMKINFPNASVLLSPEQNETIRTVHCLLSDQPSLLFHIHRLYKLSKV